MPQSVASIAYACQSNLVPQVLEKWQLKCLNNRKSNMSSSQFNQTLFPPQKWPILCRVGR